MSAKTGQAKSFANFLTVEILVGGIRPILRIPCSGRFLRNFLITLHLHLFWEEDDLSRVFFSFPTLQIGVVNEFFRFLVFGRRNGSRKGGSDGQDQEADNGQGELPGRYMKKECLQGVRDRGSLDQKTSVHATRTVDFD